MATNEKKVIIIGSSKIGKSILQSHWESPSSIPIRKPVTTTGDPDSDPSRQSLVFPPVKERKYGSRSMPRRRIPNVTTAVETSSESDYDSIRPMIYKEASVLLLCFSIVDRQSFESIKSKWNEEVEKHAPEIPKILVGLKSDLRKEDSVSAKEGTEMAKEIGASKYLECSAETESIETVVLVASRLLK